MNRSISLSESPPQINVSMESETTMPVSDDPAPLELDVQVTDERTLIALSGELDASTSSYLYAKLADVEVTNARHVVLDMAKLSFMDSSGLGVIITEHTRLKRSGGTLTIYSPSSSVRRLFEITGLTEELDIVPVSEGP
jgi:anti-anti-sigma factor